jgi:DNA-directed RNA polymerase II subunit RPB1
VIVNRQPTLHRGSIMGVKVRIWSGKTFRLPTALCPSLAGDFDGDELNVWVCQSLQARSEVRHIMAVEKHIVTSQASRPIIGFVQDTVLSAYMMTMPGNTIDRSLMYELKAVLSYSKRELEAPEAPNGEWFGRQAIGLVLPADMNYFSNKNDRCVVIRNGKMIEGQLGKETVGVSAGSFPHFLWLQYGERKCVQVLSDLNRLLTRYMFHKSFSIRLSDLRPTDEIKLKVAEVVADAERNVSLIREDADLNLHMPRESDEAISFIVSQTMTNATKIVSSCLAKTNCIYQTVIAQSKGNPVNITQIMGIVGQQLLEGERIKTRRSGVSQILTKDNSISPDGFCINSFYSGLDMAEFYAHTMAGREGLVDTSVKTSSSGYIQRRLVKAMENLVVHSDLSVRNAQGKIIQFVYGADGFDGAYMVKASLPQLQMSSVELCAAFTERELENMRVDLAEVKLTKSGCQGFFSPFRINHHLADQKHAAGDAVDDEYLIGQITELFAATGVGCMSRLAIMFWCRLQQLGSFGKKGVDEMFRLLLHDFNRSRVNVGEPVGALAAQSISEPVTQMLLDSHRAAGLKDKSALLGVPRIKELIDATKNIKTPVMTVATKSEADGELLMESLPMCFLKSVTVSSEVLRWEDVDDAFVSRFDFLHDELKNASIYAARIVLDETKLACRGLSVYLAADAIENYVSSIVYNSDDIDGKLIMIVRLLGVSDDLTDDEQRRLMEEFVQRSKRELKMGGVSGVGGAHRESPMVIKTNGSNLRETLGLPGVDCYNTTSNDVYDVLQTLGIEAATAVLHREFQHTLDHNGSVINPRHMQLLVYTISYLGYLLPISRHGLNRLAEAGTLTKASFEEVADVLIDASAFSVVDPTSGVTEKVTTGQLGNFGTGFGEFLILPDVMEPILEEESDDDVVFTHLDLVEDVEMQQSDSEEMMVPEDINMDSMFCRSLVGDAHGYLPSTPKSIICRKRIYIPTSPR